MKRYLCLLALLLAGAIVALCGAGVAVDGTKGAVTIGETTLLGDKAAAQGLTLASTVRYDYRLYWSSTFQPGREEEAGTEFTFYPGGKRSVYEFTPSMDLGMLDNVGMSGNNLKLDEEEYYGRPTKLLIDVAGRTAPGETRTETLSLADYYDHVPLNVNVSTSGAYLGPGGEYALSRAISDYCAIPVPAGYKLTVTITKDDAGNTTDINCQTTAGISLWLQCQAAVTDSVVYFALSMFDGDGLPMALPDHLNGVHRFALDVEAGNQTRLRPNSLERVYTLPADGDSVTYLALTRDGTRLLMATGRQGAATLSVLDRTTMALLQALPLPGGGTVDCLRQEDDYLLAVLGDGAFHLLQPDEGGDLEIQLSGNFLTETGREWLSYEELALAYDGERLAAAYYGLRRDDEIYEPCAMNLMVFGLDGLLYMGQYSHSADRAVRRDVGGRWYDEVAPDKDGDSLTLAFS